ncbi:MAG: hypothetical protein A2X92_07775 [Syntrophus sp. GWC2_56_31]|nr:MAG: hypothetical protein A2X92_07775 [Syntrophus sp. GWC2_56_31]
MDQEFIDKLTAISEFKRSSENEEQFAFSATFDKEKDGLIKIITDKGEFIYQLKPLEELYAEPKLRKNLEDETVSLLYEIEKTIKDYYSIDQSLTDASVIMALEKLSIKPEAPAQNDFLRNITGCLRMFMSMNRFSRSELRQGINRALRSARRHNKIDGIRGYLTRRSIEGNPRSIRKGESSSA